MLIDALVHLMAFDISWFISLIMNNFLWLFMLSAAAFFFLRKLPLIVGFIVLTLWIWANLDFANALGWTIISSGFLAFTYTVRVIGLTFASTTDRFKNRLALVSVSLFVITAALWNIFMV